MTLPSKARYVVIGAGIHGLSTAYHLARALKAKGRSSQADIVVLDKGRVGAGASGIACGVVRNNYFQPAMRELMAHSVDGLGKRSGGLFVSSGRLHADQPGGHARGVATIYEQQKAIGYESTFIEGEADCRAT